jgi:hypothetical protein
MKSIKEEAEKLLSCEMQEIKGGNQVADGCAWSCDPGCSSGCKSSCKDGSSAGV